MRLITEETAIDYVKHLLDVNRYYHPYSKSEIVPVSEVIDAIQMTPSADPEQICLYLFGYNARDLMVLAQVCRQQNIQNHELHDFVTNLSLAYKVVSDEMRETWKRAMQDFMEGLPSAQPECEDEKALKTAFLRMASYVDSLLVCSDEQKETLINLIAKVADYMPWSPHDTEEDLDGIAEEAEKEV